MVEFGPFRLDEPGRVLWRGEREVPLQPRVFDLLVFLVRNRARVVSKDELLDALWPGVTVTENSLQRAVSTLRGVLRDGGMEDALRNFPRSGYRLLVDTTPGETEQSDPEPGSATEARDAAKRAAMEQRWADAAALYRTADAAEALHGADLDGWAFVLQCLGRPSDAIPVLVRSTAAHVQTGD